MNSDTPAQSLEVCQWFYDSLTGIVEHDHFGPIHIDGHPEFVKRMRDYLHAIQNRRRVTNQEEQERLTEEIEGMRDELSTRYYNT